ncbi:hypothetical protein BGZ94_004573, partial [Podila epigama]
ATRGAVVLLNTVKAGKVKLTFKTSGTVANPVNPAPGPTKTTSTVSIPTPTVPLPSPTPVNPRVVDDFSDPQRYNKEKNVLGFSTGDDGTVTSKTSVQGDYLLLNVDTSSYWYTLLGESSKCNEYSAFKTLHLAVRFPTAKTPFGFDVVLKDADESACSTQVSHAVNVKSILTRASPVQDGWYHLDLPLTKFSELDATRLKSLTLSGFEFAGQLEVDYGKVEAKVPTS